jgi:hypothetical protein
MVFPSDVPVSASHFEDVLLPVRVLRAEESTGKKILPTAVEDVRFAPTPPGFGAPSLPKGDGNTSRQMV